MFLHAQSTITTSDPNGNVGIGTATPEYLLDLKTANKIKLRLQGGTGVFDQNGILFNATGSANSFFSLQRQFNF